METLSEYRNIRKRPEQAARCAGGQKEQGSICSLGTATDGFLRQQFLPLFEPSKKTPERTTLEKPFFDCLDSLASLYGFGSADHYGKPYPYNILLAYDHAVKQLRQSGQDIDLAIMQGKKGKLNLEARHTYHTGTTLYYIPVLPMYRLLQDKKQKKTAELLLSVFAYLYHIAGIPYYRDEGSELGYHYECMEDWILQDGEWDNREDFYSNVSELNKGSYYGDVMHRRIYNLYHLNVFQVRLKTYRPASVMQWDCLKIAKAAFALLQDYPQSTVFRNTSNQGFNYDDEIIRAEQYISFIADIEGALYNHIVQMVNDVFNECSEMEQPTITQIFDGENTPEVKGLDFEYRLFPLINDLCTLLNELP